MLRSTNRLLRGVTGLARFKSTAPIRNGLIPDKVAAATDLGFSNDKDKVLFMGTGTPPPLSLFFEGPHPCIDEPYTTLHHLPVDTSLPY